MARGFEKFKVSIPDGQSGDWIVEKFVVDKDGALRHNLHCALNDNFDGVIYPGTYTRLKRRGEVIMSDTPSEIKDHSQFIKLAKGNCLIAGLGLGMVTSAILKKKEVKRVDVVELSQDVINLTAKHIEHKKLTIHHMPIEKFKPSIDYDCVWLDIWDTICGDNLKQIRKLKKKFSNDSMDWQYVGAWSERQIMRMRY